MSLLTDENLIRFTGRGLAFPIVVENGKPVLSTGTDLIKSSIKIAIFWPNSTRYFLGEFGSKIKQILQEPNDRVLFELVNHYIIDAVNRFEKRIKLLQVTMDNNLTTNSIDVKLTYLILNSNIQDSFIIPFYKNITY